MCISYFVVLAVIVLRSTSTSSATSVTASTAGYGAGYGGTILWGWRGARNVQRAPIYTYMYYIHR